MDVNLVVVLLTVVTRNEAFVLEWVATHNTSCNGFLDFVVELFDASDALLFTILATPDGQWSAPVTAAAQVPVIEVLKPFAKASGASVLWFPLDGLVEFHHAVFACS